MTSRPRKEARRAAGFFVGCEFSLTAQVPALRQGFQLFQLDQLVELGALFSRW
jgi:hypothetical protein